MALVDADGFSLVLVRAGVPVVWRQKSFTEGLSDADRARLLTSELRLTRTLLGERFPGETLAALYLAAPRAVEPFWLQVLAQGLDCQPARLRVEHLGLAAAGGRVSRSRWQEPNLARAPFVNERPVRRLAVTLWLLFALVGGLAAWQAVASRQATSARLAELARLNTEAAAARERAATLERELRGADLPAQNERTAFLNRRLAERAFSWSRLLESVTAVMPRGVRLVRLSPEGFGSEQRRAGMPVRAAATTRVEMRVSGEAEETEALLEFVDRLFQHPAFDQPNLARESERKDSRIQFELAVAYLPEVAGDSGAAATSAVASSAATTAATTASTAPATSTLMGAVRSDAASPTTAATPGAPAAPRPGETGGTGSLAGAASPPAAAAGQASVGKVVGSAPPPASAKVGSPPAGRSTPGSRAGTPTSAWEGGEDPASEDKAAEDRAAEAASAGGRITGRPAGAVPAMGGAAGGGLRPAAGSGAPFPGNVMPTPLRPYASTTGGGR